LQTLNLSNTQVTGTGLKALKEFKDLQTLNLTLCPVTDAGLTELRHLKRLQRLELYSTLVTDLGLKELKVLRDLRSLHISGNQVTDTGLKELRELQSLQELTLAGTKVTDEGLKELKELKRLQTLHLGNTQVTGAGLKELKSLQSLDLSKTKITDGGLRELKELKSLQALDLDETQVTGAGLKELKNLQALDLCLCPVTDTGLRGLKELKSLQTLKLTATQITDAGLKELSELRNLHTLDLSNTKVTDAGLKHLKELKNLHSLRLGFTAVTNVGLKELKEFKKLQRLDLVSTKTTDRGLAEFEAACPQLLIEGGGSLIWDNNRVICMDLRSGKVLWEHRPDRISIALLELYKDGLFIQRSTPRVDNGGPLYLDAKTGKPVKEFKRDRGRLLANSAILDDTPVVLANGWRLEPRFGDRKTLQFVEPKSGTETWRIEIGDSISDLCAWNDFVFYALDMHNSKGVFYAYRAGGKKPAWTVDLNHIIKDKEAPLTRMFFRVIEDTVYVQAHQHIFALKPESGKLLWHRNLVTDLDLEYSDLHGPGNDWSSMTKDGNILVIAYEMRVIALDLKAKKYLWHLYPDSYAAEQYPIAYDGKLYLSSGPKRKLKPVR
jgi:Leucine-rich repeat (LRR) protein